MKNTAQKRIIITIATVLLLLLLLSVAVTVLNKCDTKQLGTNGVNTDPPDIDFSDEYITEREILESDAKYMGYDRMIYYYDSQTSVRVGMEPDQYEHYGEAVVFLCDFVEAIIAGDADAYNAMFSDSYYLENDPKESFSMQKLYDIQISSYVKSEEIKEEGIIYLLDYKIRRNNGSFRRDIDSDGSRTQYIYLREYNGSYLIDRIVAP